MFYRGMPDTYEYEGEYRGQKTLWQAFWYEGEFYLLRKTWKFNTGNPEYWPGPSQYFEDVNDLLLAMLEIAPYKDWKRVEAPTS